MAGDGAWAEQSFHQIKQLYGYPIRLAHSQACCIKSWNTSISIRTSQHTPIATQQTTSHSSHSKPSAKQNQSISQPSSRWAKRVHQCSAYTSTPSAPALRSMLTKSVSAPSVLRRYLQLNAVNGPGWCCRMHFWKRLSVETPPVVSETPPRRALRCCASPPVQINSPFLIS